jgi:hypothetical protein
MKTLLIALFLAAPAAAFELPHRIETNDPTCESIALSWGGVSAAYEHPGETTGTATFDLSGCDSTVAGGHLSVQGIKGFKDGLGKNIDLSGKGFEWEHACDASACTIWVTNTKKQTKAARWSFSVLFE